MGLPARGPRLAALAAVAGIVLAGGRSTRFGATDKLTADLAGMPLLHHAVLRVAEVVDDVIVVRAPGATTIALPPGVRVAHDATEGEGPLAGAHAGLVAAASSEVAVVVGGDMPELQPSVLREMLEVIEDTHADATALADDGGPRPLPIVVRVRPATEAAHALLHDGRRRLRELGQALRMAVIDETTWTALDPQRRTLHDVDEPDDL